MFAACKVEVAFLQLSTCTRSPLTPCELRFVVAKRFARCWTAVRGTGTVASVFSFAVLFFRTFCSVPLMSHSVAVYSGAVTCVQMSVLKVLGAS